MRVIVPALHYADFLEVTLPAWRALLPDAHIIAVAGPDDFDWIANHPPGHKDRSPLCPLTLFCSDAWTKGGATLNKAAALQSGLDLDGGPEQGEVCICADADVVPFGTLPDLQPGTLYGCARYACQDPETLERHRRGELAREQLTLIPPRRRGQEPEYDRGVTAQQAAEACTGYFQAFRYRPGLTFDSYPTAAGYDSAFRSQFTRCVGLTDFYVLHLGELSRENWKGRVVPPWPAGAPA